MQWLTELLCLISRGREFQIIITRVPSGHVIEGLELCPERFVHTADEVDHQRAVGAHKVMQVAAGAVDKAQLGIWSEISPERFPASVSCQC